MTGRPCPAPDFWWNRWAPRPSSAWRLGEMPVIALVRERLAVVPGDTLHLRPKAGTMHLFDAAGSGARLE